ncbi:MAG: BREX-4 system phosphatase PglZ [Prevotella sp.]|nr:BREX-4 system phosphatase PglZ [Prevotella sp.]
MYEELTNFEALKKLVRDDKECWGVNATTLNRYPLRFVLFDDFKQCSEFVDFVQYEVGAVVQSVDKWMDHSYPDIMLTYTQLAAHIKDYVRESKGADCVIAPFSELARFYDNEKNKTFEALLKTIKGIEALPVALDRHQRVYIPIVGLEGKMEPFSKDSQSIIWRLKTPEQHFTYRLILTDGETYNVQGLENKFTVVNNIFEWLSIWKDTERQTNQNIICTSKSVYANVRYARPDNAFSFVICNNAYEFLTKGLRLKFGGIEFKEEEEKFWVELASHIDISNDFDFTAYVSKYFNVSVLSDYKTFIRLWLSNNGVYERWLLAHYYRSHISVGDYIRKILLETKSLTGNNFIEQMAMNFTSASEEIRIRKYCLMEAAKKHITMRNEVQSTVTNRLESIAHKYNAASALKYFTGISEREKELAITWLGKGLITKENIQNIYPDLFSYLSEPIGVSLNGSGWLAAYFDAYKKAKISNTYTEEIKTQIGKVNANEIAFDSWYQDFSTTRTLMMNRHDIDIYYWIDGLGVDWIPLIRKIINERNSNGIYLNEVKVARAILPTKTSVNKPDLQKLLPDGDVLQKSGDIDALAHQSSNLWPNIIVEEIQKVREIIEEILDKYNGKKIAIISDHGLTYLSQLCKGLGLSCVESDHHGRIAKRTSGTWTKDDNYMVLDDGITACALNHKSLCDKVPKGQGIHGGCTPEEVLVPIFIISNREIAIDWSAELLTTEISGANPQLRYEIKNVKATDVPYVLYDGRRYKLHRIEGDVFESEPLLINPAEKVVAITIGNRSIENEIEISAGAVEDDPFAF